MFSDILCYIQCPSALVSALNMIHAAKICIWLSAKGCHNSETVNTTSFLASSVNSACQQLPDLLGQKDLVSHGLHPSFLCKYLRSAILIANFLKISS